jgi:hypothetical protein
VVSPTSACLTCARTPCSGLASAEARVEREGMGFTSCTMRAAERKRKPQGCSMCRVSTRVSLEWGMHVPQL